MSYGTAIQSYDTLHLTWAISIYGVCFTGPPMFHLIVSGTGLHVFFSIDRDVRYI